MMRLKVIDDADVVSYVVVRDPGDEAVAALEQFARAESVWKRRRSLPLAALSHRRLVRPYGQGLPPHPG
jgi:hypothetical protein